MRHIHILAFLLLLSIAGKAQQYNRAIGIRSSNDFSILYEKQINDESNYRFTYSFGYGRGQKISAYKIFQYYKLDDFPPNLSFHFGYGAHIGYCRWRQFFKNEHGQYWDKMYRPILGLDGIVGLAYNFTSVPLAISLDVNPCFDLWGKNYMNIQMLNTGVGLIYYF